MDDLWHAIEHPALKAAVQMASLLFARILPMTVLTPIFGGQTMPRRLRTGLNLLFTLALLPAFLPTFTTPVDVVTYTILLAKEAIVGFTLAFFILIVFESLSAIGALIDLARGATMANVLDPLTQNQESILAMFFTQLAIVLFLSIGGIRMLFSALGDSFIILRPQALLPSANIVGPGAAESPISIVGDIFLIALKIGAPAVIVLLLLDFGLSVINRVAPQIQVYFLGMTLKGTVGLLIVLLAFGITVDLFINQFAGALHALRAWTNAAR
jgi:flagellar biosynthesis protein FliR